MKKEDEEVRIFEAVPSYVFYGCWIYQAFCSENGLVLIYPIYV
jgi:hypothetical protein